MGLLPLQRKYESHSQPDGTGISKTLLIVDDEPQVIKSIVRVLKREDFHILTAGSGEMAMEIIKDEPVGVVLTDQNISCHSVHICHHAYHLLHIHIISCIL